MGSYNLNLGAVMDDSTCKAECAHAAESARSKETVRLSNGVKFHLLQGLLVPICVERFYRRISFIRKAASLSIGICINAHKGFKMIV
jgi:hypothetical protein